MGFTKFFSSLNPFSTTRRKRPRTRRQKRHNTRTRRRIMKGGWGEPIILSNKKNIIKGGWGGALPPINNI